MEISKELLQCLNKHLTVDKVISNGQNRIDNNIYWNIKEIDILQSRNVCELAFRLKDWAYIQIKDRIDLYYSPVICSQYNIDISSGRSPNVRIKYNSILNKNIKGDYYCRVSESDNSGQYRTFIAETEVEAIIKACEWILNEKQLQH